MVKLSICGRRLFLWRIHSTDAEINSECTINIQHLVSWSQSDWTPKIALTIKIRKKDTVDGQTHAPPRMMMIPLFIGF